MVSCPLFQSRLPLRILIGAVLAASPGAARAGAVLHVDAGASGSGSGTSWADAFTKLQDALAVAVSGDQVWVAGGAYFPDEGAGAVNDDAASSFTPRPGVALYGGFSGCESGLDQRDWKAHSTVLSGDLAQDDLNADSNRVAETWNDIAGSNARHVVYLDGVTTSPVTGTTVLDGFIITAGDAADDGSTFIGGGGLFCLGGRFTSDSYCVSHTCACSPTLANLTFSGNRTDINMGTGGGLYNHSNWGGTSSPALNNVAFKGNRAYFGGGLYNLAVWGNSSPTLADVTFAGNLARSGGGMGGYGLQGTVSPALTNVLFSGNRAGNDGGSGDGGGMLNSVYNGTSLPTLTNVTFAGNYAASGGGAMSNSGDPDHPYAPCKPTLTNCILWGNSGAQVVNAWNAAPTLSFSLVQGGCPAGAACGAGMLYIDPLFVAPVAPGGAPATAGDYRLQSGSPAIDAGSPATCPADDLDGRPRGDQGCDMGAYEAEQVPPVEELKLYKEAGSGPGDIRLEWKPRTGAAGYRVYRSTRVAFGYVLVQEVGASPARDVGALSGDGHYFYIVLAH